MGQVIFIMWRESVEALLVVGILYAWLSRTPEAAGGKRWLWGGVVLGLLLAALLALGIYTAEEMLLDYQDVFQTAMVLVAALLIAQMVLWMRAHGRTLRKDLEQGLSERARGQHWWGVTVLAALAIAREGSEAVVFLYGTIVTAPAEKLPMLGLAALGGLVLAFLTFWVLQLGGKVLNWRVFFRITEIMLLLLAAALVVTGLEKMQALEWLPTLHDGVWDTSWLLSDMGGVGGLVAALTGYRAQPSLMTVLGYVAWWVVILWLMRRSGRARAPGGRPWSAAH